MPSRPLYAIKTKALSYTLPADEVQHVNIGVRHDASPSMEQMMEQRMIELEERLTGKLKGELN
jgi:hypothetical protein